MSEISHSNSSSDQPLHPTPLLQPQDQSSSSNELIHMLKKTTKTGGAAVDILKNRVAGTFPWINTTSDSKAKLATSPTSSGSEVTSPSPSVTSSPSRSQQAQQPPPSSSPNSSSHLSKKSLSEKSSRKPSPLLFTQTSSQKNLSATPSPPLLTASTRHSKKRIPSIRRNNKHNTSLEPNTTTTIVPLTSPIALNPTFYDYNTHTHHSYALASSTSPYLRKSKSAESNAATFTSPKSAPILSSSRFFFTASPNTPSGKPSNTDDHYHLESTLDDEKRKGTLFEKAFGKQQKEDVDEKVFKEDIEERGEDTEEEEEEEKEDKVKEDEEEGDFVPYLPHSQKQDVVRRYHRTRSLSDSLLFDPGYLTTIQQQQNTEWKKESDPGGNDLTPEKLKRSNTMTLGTSSYSRLMPHAIDMDDLIFNADVYGKEASTMVDGRDETAPQRPKTIMNVQTYLIFERLLQKQRQLEQYYQQVKSIAAVYEKTADRLKMTYENRMKAFEQLQSKSRRVIDEQSTTAQRLKHVEDHSAKLHYELNVLNDKLKEIEENVGTFFGKVGVLERKMGVSGARTSPASPSQATTGQSSASASMMIVGNYLNHYWTKISQWMTWLQPKESLSHDQNRIAEKEAMANPLTSLRTSAREHLQRRGSF
ncbi:hypothetical protein BDF20DRAFT_837543 [Mycotypha africana]|uniref:uncharacterized protein n=1 Tax=Mycotypha africana TaxID=64632 RepID=UPI0023002642|nr:uncharacterized protein BDF20DRAFT_837543 [Mycotypha africana]KAI8973615.1 hypothetical protein BDF20DRAFT_837543 [Mycotypha africana]